MVPPDLPGDLDLPHDPRRRHRANDFDHIEPRVETAFRAAQKNRPLDLAALDVCLRDRRDHLLAALHPVSAAIKGGRKRAQEFTCQLDETVGPSPGDLIRTIMKTNNEQAGLK